MPFKKKKNPWILINRVSSYFFLVELKFQISKITKIKKNQIGEFGHNSQLTHNMRLLAKFGIII